MRAVDRTIEIGHIDGLGGPLSTAVTIYHPDTVPERPVVVFAFPGGGYSRGYFDIHRPELPGPSQVEFHCARGLIVVACDHIGVGESSQPDPAAITFEHLAEANDRTTREVLMRLESGSLAKDLDPVDDPLVVGMGQSMGACISVVQQATYRTFSALAVLGYAGARMHLPQPSDGTDPIRYAFHWDEEPDSLVEADLGGQPQPWRSATMPACVPSMANSGLIASEAAVIDVPLFLAAGQRDVIEDLYSEPDAFRSSPDITLFLLRRSAHMHNFALTREELWARFQRWIESLIAW